MHLISFVLFICTIIYTQSTIADFSFKKIYNTITRKSYQETIYEELNPRNTSLLTVKNKQGNVTIKTDPQQKNIFVKVTKKSPDASLLSKVTFHYGIKNQEMILESAFNPSEIEGSIDFDIIVPQKMAFNVSTQTGDTYIKDAHAPLRASTQKGSIILVNPHNSVEVQTQIKGNIALHNPTGRIKAETQSGNISIFDAQGSVIADTHQGAIQMIAKEVPSTGTIKLATISGHITLHLPADVNADLHASTKQGIITSDHFITLKPQTTRLNKQTWNRIQKQVDGTIGSGTAHIKLSSVKSNIKLLETKIS